MALLGQAAGKNLPGCPGVVRVGGRVNLEKIVLTHRNHMRAVVLTLERYAELERNAA